MRKKIFFILAACGAAVLLAGAVVFFQFKGNAVRAESELFVSAQADYGQLADSLMPVSGTAPRSGSTPAESVWPTASSRVITSSAAV